MTMLSDEEKYKELASIIQACVKRDPNAIYCYDVRRNGRNKDGSPNKRSIEKSNKAQSLRRKLYERYCNDTNLSFSFQIKKKIKEAI